MQQNKTLKKGNQHAFLITNLLTLIIYKQFLTIKVVHSPQLYLKKIVFTWSSKYLMMQNKRTKKHNNISRSAQIYIYINCPNFYLRWSFRAWYGVQTWCSLTAVSRTRGYTWYYFLRTLNAATSWNTFSIHTTICTHKTLQSHYVAFVFGT